MAKKLLNLEHKEFVREHYLKATGIDLWYPKFKFANSKRANKTYIEIKVVFIASMLSRTACK